MPRTYTPANLHPAAIPHRLDRLGIPLVTGLGPERVAESDPPPSPRPIYGIEEQECAGDAAGRPAAGEPVKQRVRGVGADRLKARRPEPEHMEDLCRPERDDRVRHGVEPAANAETLGDRCREVRPLRVVAAERLLEIRKARSILHVEERASIRRQGEDVGSPGELVVLEWLVQGDGEAVRGQDCRLHLTNQRVNRVDRAGRSGPTLIHQVELGPEAERSSDRGIAPERSGVSALETVHLGHRQTAARGQLSERPSATPAFLMDLGAGFDGHASRDMSGPRLDRAARGSFRHFHAK